MWYFILHELIPTYKDNYGRRNCRVFIYGVVLYCATFIILLNLLLYNKISKLLYDALFWIGIIILMSDICVMAYEYKFFFGRNILNEVKELGKDDIDYKWKYDDKNHKYNKIYNQEKNDKKKNKIVNKFVKINKNENNLREFEKINKNTIFDNLFTESNKSDKSNKSIKSVKSVKLDKSNKSDKSNKTDKSNKSVKLF